MENADVFIDLSTRNIVDEDMIRSMAKNPIVFAIEDSISEELSTMAIKAGAKVIATGRADLPNQMSDVLVFPGIFRGALDIRATDINGAMKMAAVQALVELATEEIPSDIYDILENIYPEDVEKGIFEGDNPLKSTFIIPRIFDNRVVPRIARKVAEAAIDTGVSQVNIVDFDDYEFELMLRIKS